MPAEVVRVNPNKKGKIVSRKTKEWPAHEQFVEAWQKADGVDAVCKSLGIDRNDASAQAAYLRRQGVPLRKFTGTGRPKADYTGLAGLAKRLAKA